MEVEAKFTIPDMDTVERLKRVVRLGAFLPGEAVQRKVVDTYLDTGARDLLAIGYTCRIRVQDGQRLLTIKGLGRADSVIQERIESEIALEEEAAVSPEAWPEEGVWAAARSAVGQRPLSALFVVKQTRSVRELREGDRLAAELSIDEVRIEAAGRSQSFWLAEIELRRDGTRDDLEVLVDHLASTWGLTAETSTKYHLGLALLDRQEGEKDQGERRLSSAEHAQLEYIVEHADSERVRRRALLLLGWARHTPVSQVAVEVGGSRSWAYGWLERFRDERMAVFPADLLSPPSGEPVTLSRPGVAQVSPVVGAMPRSGLGIDEMMERFAIDAAHARCVADHALALFDATAELHRLSTGRRRLLEIMGLFHDVGLSTDAERHHVAGRDIVLEHPLAEISDVEQRMLAAAVFLHRRRIGRKRLNAGVVSALPPGIRQDTLGLTALLRVADGLDATRRQSSQIELMRVAPDEIRVSVEGPDADTEARCAQAKADLWYRLFGVPFVFSAPRAAPASVRGGTALEGSLAPVPDMQEARLPSSPGVLPDDPMSEAGRKVLRFHFLRMLAHEPGTRKGDDIEELHDMRVATRRMRAAFRVFAPYFQRRAIRSHVAGLRRTARALGAVRDLDVLAHKARAYLDTLPEGREHDLDPLLLQWQTEREDARDAMLASLDSPKYGAFKDAFWLFLETPGSGAKASRGFPPEPLKARHVVPVRILERWASVQAFDAALEEASLPALHALRIECKRLRYTLEFFRETLGDEVQDVISEVVRLQDHLGDLNDADVANSMLSEFLFARSGDAQAERVIAPGVVSYLAVKQRELQELLETFPQTWALFNRPEVRRWLASAVAVL